MPVTVNTVALAVRDGGRAGRRQVDIAGESHRCLSRTRRESPCRQPAEVKLIVSLKTVVPKAAKDDWAEVGRHGNAVHWVMCQWLRGVVALLVMVRPDGPESVMVPLIVEVALQVPLRYLLIEPGPVKVTALLITMLAVDDDPLVLKMSEFAPAVIAPVLMVSALVPLLAYVVGPAKTWAAA